MTVGLLGLWGLWDHGSCGAIGPTRLVGPRGLWGLRISPSAQGLRQERRFSVTKMNGAALASPSDGMLHLTIDYSQLSALSATIKAGILANWVLH